MLVCVVYIHNACHWGERILHCLPGFVQLSVVTIGVGVRAGLLNLPDGEPPVTGADSLNVFEVFDGGVTKGAFCWCS